MHPDKNMGSALASEAFKRVQCAYEVIIHTCYSSCIVIIACLK